MSQVQADLFLPRGETSARAGMTKLREDAIKYARQWASTQDDFRLDEEWIFVREEGDRTYHTVHRFHPYYALFPPPLIVKLVTEYSKPGELVADPFCGGGVTAVESMLLGRQAYASDISPLAALVTKVKTTPLTISSKWANDLSLKVHEEISGTKFGRQLKGARIPAMHNIDHWFSPETQRKLAIILKMIGEVEDRHRRDFLTVTFSSILRKCSMSQNLESHLRVRKGKKPSDPIIFVQRLHDMVTRMNKYRAMLPPGVAARVDTADARTLSQRLGENSVDLIVTSPPYGTTAKYTSIYKLSFDWLDLPRPHKPLENSKDFLHESLLSMKEMYTVLKRSHHCCFIYGTNKEFSSSQIIGLAKEVGFQVALAVSAPVIDASKSVRGDYRRGVPVEHILVLRKP
jgi:hypothetical protein